MNKDEFKYELHKELSGLSIDKINNFDKFYDDWLKYLEINNIKRI